MSCFTIWTYCWVGVLEPVWTQTLLCCVFVFLAFRKFHSKTQTQTRLSSSQSCGMRSEGSSAQLPRAMAIISTPLQTSRKCNFDSRPATYRGCGFTLAYRRKIWIHRSTFWAWAAAWEALGIRPSMWLQTGRRNKEKEGLICLSYVLHLMSV